MSTQQHAGGVRTDPVATAPGSDPDTLAIPFFYFPILDLLIYYTCLHRILKPLSRLRNVAALYIRHQKFTAVSAAPGTTVPWA